MCGLVKFAQSYGRGEATAKTKEFCSEAVVKVVRDRSIDLY